MKKYIIMITALSFLGACSEDFIEEAQQPYDLKTTENFYQTPEDATEALTAVYDVLQYGGYGHIILTSEIASDDCFGGSGVSDGPGAQVWDRFESYNDQNIDAWTKYYQGIYRANILLANLDQVDWTDNEELRTQYEAEARFLRAYFYFDLARMFGPVPLITEPLNPGEYYIPKATEEELYSQIGSDLKFAADNLAAVTYGAMATSDFGRVTKWAAEGLLAKVFLFYTDYYETSDLAGVVSKQEAITYLDDVIQNSGYGLVDDFSTLWRAASRENFAGENNQEFIWVIKYTYKGLRNWDRMDGNRWQVMIGLRNQTIGGYAIGWGFGPVNPELWNAYNPADTRRSASIIDIEGEGLDFDATDQRQYTGYAWKKFMPTSDEDGDPTTVNLGGDFQIDNFDDYPAVRFADVLLMAAELNLDENLGKSQQYFDMIRDRAFQDQAHRITLASGDAGKSTIMTERRLELALEGDRYFDLIRQSMQVAANAINNTGDGEPFDVTFRPETGGYLQIPQTQINISNGTLIQNEGW